MRLILILTTSLMLTAASCRDPKIIKNSGDPLLTVGSGSSSEALSGGGRDGSEAPDEVIAAMVENFNRVHFDYDSYSLDEGSRDALSRNAALMQSWGSLEVEIQGHSDDRGSTEYNLALGHRRAAAVREAMIGMGVSPGRVGAISFGEEAPLDRASGEVAWASNRRAEFRVTSGDAQVQGTVD